MSDELSIANTASTTAPAAPPPPASPKLTAAEISAQKQAEQAKANLAAQEVYKQQVGKRFRGDLRKIHGTAGQAPAAETVAEILEYLPNVPTVLERGGKIENRQCFSVSLGNPHVQYRYPCFEFMQFFTELTGESPATGNDLPQ